MEIESQIWATVTEVFAKVIELDESERDVFLTKHLENQPAVLREVRSLLSYHSDDNFLETPILNKVLSTLSTQGATPLTDWPAGYVVDDFEIIKQLGSGSFGTVYSAIQKSLNRVVALKVTPDFGDEAKTMAQLSNENIVRVYSQKKLEGQGLRLICMQYVAGVTLDRLLIELAQNPKSTFVEALDSLNLEPVSFDPSALKDREELSRLDSLESICWIVARLADALNYAHSRGILHLDIKPSNILMTPYGRPLLTDFNVSLDFINTENEKPQIIGGTLGYMSPEQTLAFDAGGKPTKIPIDARSDLFSLGKVLQEMLFRASFATESLDIAIRKIIDRCIKESADDRPANALEISRALKSNNELRRIHRNLPKAGFLTRIELQRPIVALILGLLLPQLAGSAVNISYNSLRIVSHLTSAQQELFQWSCIVYNFIIYPACLFFVIKKLSPIRNGLKLTSNDQTELRAAVLSVPLLAVFVTTLGWLPGSLLFPFILHWAAGPVETWVFVHFFLSFVTSWWVALTYSFLSTQAIGMRSLYPKFWEGTTNISEIAASELRVVEGRSKVFLFLAGGIPLIGALMVVMSKPNNFSESDYQSFRFLVTVLISLGIVGLIFAIRATNNITNSIRSFVTSSR